MENYIVRIYRRDAQDPERVSGLVEVVGDGATRPFTSFEELSEILLPGRKAAEQRTGKKEKRRKGERA